MRKSLLLFLMGFICFPIFADKIPIEPIPPKEGEKRNDRESILVPSASVENGVINIETELASWGVAITIYNSDGAEVYTSVSVDESKQHSFAIEALSADDYTLEVQIGENYYEGEFTIN